MASQNLAGLIPASSRRTAEVTPIRIPVETFDAVLAYAMGEGDCPLLEGLTGEGLHFWQSDHGRDEAVRFAAKRSPLRKSAIGLPPEHADLLLARPLQVLVDRLNRLGLRYARQVERFGQE